MNTLIIVIFLFSFSVLMLLSNILLYKSDYKKLLFAIIPIQLFVSVFVFTTIESFRGSPSYHYEVLYDTPFEYLTHFPINKDEVYILVNLENSPEPKFFRMPINDEMRKQLEKAKGGKKQGLKMIGEFIRKKSNNGEFQIPSELVFSTKNQELQQK